MRGPGFRVQVSRVWGFRGLKGLGVERFKGLGFRASVFQIVFSFRAIHSMGSPTSTGSGFKVEAGTNILTDQKLGPAKGVKGII